MEKASALAQNQPSQQKIINNEYILGEKIGEGAFSKVYAGNLNLYRI